MTTTPSSRPRCRLPYIDTGPYDDTMAILDAMWPEAVRTERLLARIEC